MMPKAEWLGSGTRATFWRTLQTFGFTRIVIAAVLLLYVSLNTKPMPGAEQLLRKEFYLIYLLVAIGLSLVSFYWRRRFGLQLLAQILIDIGAISLLYIGAGGSSSGLAILYLFPLCGSAILMSMVPALFFVSLVTLVMLGDSGFRLLNEAGDGTISYVGLYGAAFFAAVFVVNRLARKVIKQENLAIQRGHDLKMQEAINRLVIADLEDGILVVGPDSTIFAANPAAERLIGLSGQMPMIGARLSELPPLAPIADAFVARFGKLGRQSAPATDTAAFVMIKPGGDHSTLQGGTTVVRETEQNIELGTRLKLRFAAVDSRDLEEARIIIYIQDVSRIENQAQNLKLASMGRLTASIAHEVRNPLSAIGHAASLLREDLADPAQLRMLQIVGDNVGRLNRMIEDILKLSRKAQLHREQLPLAAFMTRVVAEFNETHAVPRDVIQLGHAGAHRVGFDPLHLEEVLVNLLSNARRYASGKKASIRLWVVADRSNRLEIHVQDDGPGIKPQVRAHLFEPFYTTSSKGTGLGLYLARELCLNNGAMLDYEYRLEPTGDGMEKATGRFVISFSGADA